MGEFSKNKDYWSEQSRTNPNLKLQLVEGSEDYLSNWMHEIAKTLPK